VAEAIRVLPGRPESARAAREFTADCLPGCPLVYEAMVCVDELVANAVQHSRSGLPGGTITVRVTTRPGDWLRVDVEDAGPMLRLVPRQAAPDDAGQLAEHGRGLVLVDVLADASGAATGVAWFRMAWDRGPQASAPAPAWELRRRAVLDRSGAMCQCAGQCGRAGHRCAFGDAPGHPLHIVPADPAEHDTAAAALPAGDLVALCQSCWTGRDRVTARARDRAAAPPDALFAFPSPGGRP
jgi:hypothetical protein